MFILLDLINTDFILETLLVWLTCLVYLIGC